MSKLPRDNVSNYVVVDRTAADGVQGTGLRSIDLPDGSHLITLDRATFDKAVAAAMATRQEIKQAG